MINIVVVSFPPEGSSDIELKSASQTSKISLTILWLLSFNKGDNPNPAAAGPLDLDGEGVYRKTKVREFLQIC